MTIHPSLIEEVDRRTTNLAQNLHEYGFDICHPFHPTWYNDLLQKQNLDLSPLKSGNAALFIGNTKHLWPYFISWYQRRKTITNQEEEISNSQTSSSSSSSLSSAKSLEVLDKELQNPLDTYCQEFIEKALIMSTSHGNNGNLNLEHQKRNDNYTIYWSSCYKREKLIAMQRVAKVSGYAYFDSHTKLTIHPVNGMWHSYRAVVVFHCDSSTGVIPPPPPPPYLTSLISPEEEEKAESAMRHALEVSNCSSKLCSQLHGKELDKKIAEAWIAVRDSIEIGKEEYRFEHNQLMYHYTKNMDYLSK